MESSALAVSELKSSTTSLIELRGAPNNRLVLDNVYLNGLHALRRFYIINRTCTPLLVKLRSNLGDQIAFQLTNENFPEPEPTSTMIPSTTCPDRPMSASTQRNSANTLESSLDSITGETMSLVPSARTSVRDVSPSSSIEFTPVSANTQRPIPHQTLTLTTNTSDAAALGLLVSGGSSSPSFAHGHQFNQLFNFVNHIDELVLEPFAVQQVIIAFLPDEKHNRGPKVFDGERIESSENTPFVRAGIEEAYDFAEINGLVFLFAYMRNRMDPLSFQNMPEDSQASKTVSLPKSRPSSSKGSKQSQDSSIPSSLVRKSTESQPNVNTTRDIVESIPAAGAPDQQLSIKFRSRVCRTMLATDIESGGIVFDDCVVGGSYFKDFTIWNRSEIDLYVGLTTVEVKGVENDLWIQFSDYDSGDPLTTAPIPAYSPRRIRITFKPQEVGEISYDFQVENLNDTSNTVQLTIHAFVRSVFREEHLVISTGSTLDFGDCVAGSWRKQKLVLRNVSEQPLDVSLASDSSCVIFQLVLNEDDRNIVRYQDVNAHQPSSSHHSHHHHHHSHHLMHDKQQNHFHPRRRRHTHDSNDDIPGAQPISESASYHEIGPPANMSAASKPLRQGDNLPVGSPASFERLLMDKLQTVSSSMTRQQSDISPTQTSSSSIDSSPSRKDMLTASDNASLDIIDVLRPHSRASSSFLLGADEVSRFGGNSPHSLHDTLQDNGQQAEELTRIEELQLRPGSERVIEVCYRPSRDLITPDFRAGRLTRRNFRITISYSQASQTLPERKLIQCVARACTSFIEVIPKDLHFGDSDVGTLNSRTLTVYNRSDLPAQFEMRFLSKVLSTVRGEMTIPAQQHVDVKVDIYPRKVNPDYSKQITVINLLNRDNDESVQVRSNNIDKQRVTFHSLFYHILTSTSTNYLDFGYVVLNCPAVRTFTIQNLSKQPLVIQIISSSPEELNVYTKTPEQKSVAIEPREAALQRREKLIESIDDRRKSKRSTVDSSGIGVMPVSSTVKPPITHLLVDTGLRVESSTPVAEYLDLASDSPGWKSPKRKSTKVSMAQVAQLKGLRQKLLRERIKMPNREESIRTSVATDISGNKDDGSDPLSAQTGEPLDKTTSPLTGDGEALDSVMDAATGTRVTTDALLSFLEKSCGTPPPTFTKLATEEKYVKYQYWLKRELQASIDDKRLIPASQLEIPPEGSATVVILFSTTTAMKPFVQGKPKKHDARLFIKLVDFDRNISQPQFEGLLKESAKDIPVREIMVRSTLYRSIMELGQKNINFGVTDKHSRLSKSILIRNNSEAPLLYTIRKSGSVASGDIIFYEGRMGIIRPYGKREVEFVFEPSLSGPFQEKLTIENIQDPENHQIVTVKATVRQPANFFIESLELDFGPCLPGDRGPRQQYIVLSNTSQKHTRTFEIHYDPNEFSTDGFFAQFEFELLEGDLVYEDQEVVMEDGSKQKQRRLVRKPPMMLTTEAEEQIEQLEQKLKIAHRKGRKDKVKKITDRLKRLKAGQAIDEYGEQSDSAIPNPEDALVAASDVELNANDLGLVQERDAVPQFRKIENGIVFSVGPRCIQKIRISIIPRIKEGSFNSPNRVGTSGVTSPKSQVLGSDKGQVASPSGLQSPIEGTVDSQQDSRTKVCVGTIHVNESKNSDVIKKIRFQAIICFDHFTFLQALAAESERLTREGLPEEAADIQQKLQLEQINLLGTSPPATNMFSNDASYRVSEVSLNTSLLGMPNPNQLAITSATLSSVYDSATTPQAAFPQLSPPRKAIEIEVSVIDLGRLELGERKECYFTIRNLTENEVDYSIMLLDSPALLQFGDMSGTLIPLEVKKIEMWLIPFKKGRMVESFRVITSFGQDCSVTFTCYGILGRYLDFKVLDTSRQLSELDFGYCFVDTNKKYASSVAVVIENLTPDDVLVTTSSNLAQQCLIFSDSTLETPATELQLLALAKRTVYVVLQPYMSGGINLDQRKESVEMPLVLSEVSTESLQRISSQIECRNLIGGIKFNVQIKEPLEEEYSHLGQYLKKSLPTADNTMLLSVQTLKFKAVIGQSWFLPSRKTIHFGIARKGDMINASLGVYNLSLRLPLDVDVVLPSLTKLVVDQIRVHVDPTANDETAVTFLEPQLLPKADLNLCLRCSTAGLVSETIELVNAHNSSQTSHVNIEAFVDPGLVGARQLPVSTTSGLPILSFDDVYVLPVEAQSQDDHGHKFIMTKKYRQDLAPVYEKSFEIENLTDELLQLVPWSDIFVSVRWLLSSSSGFVVESPSSGFAIMNNLSEMTRPVITNDVPVPGCTIVGTRLLLHPKEKATMIVSLQQLKPTNSTKGVDSVIAGAKGSQYGSIFLFNPDRSVVCTVIDTAVSFGVSRVEVEPVKIELGKVGHYNMWQDVKSSLTLNNPCDLTLYCDLELPDAVELTCYPQRPESSSASETASSRRRIAARSTMKIDFQLKTRRLESLPAGSHNLQIKIFNSFNPRNTVVVPISFTLTQFELKFDRLECGEVVLPALTHPLLPLSNGSDNWFTITNGSQEEVKFDIGATYAPDVKDILTFEISSRFSNSPITGVITLAPKGVVEVRVKAVPLNKVRLSSQDGGGASLVNETGITFGNLWITSRNQQASQGSQEDSRLAENIPIRGTLLDGQIFALSPSQMVFHAVLGEDETSSRQEGDSLSKKQREVIQIRNLSTEFPLEFRVDVDFPIELSTGSNKLGLFPLDSDLRGVVPPNSTFNITVVLLDPSIGGISRDILIHVTDLNSVATHRETVALHIIEDQSGKLKPVPNENERDNEMHELSLPPAELQTSSSALNVIAVDLDRSEGQSRASLVSNENIDINILTNAERESSSAFNDEALLLEKIHSTRDTDVPLHPSPLPLPLTGALSLKGCKKLIDTVSSEFQGLYSLDLGQLDVSTTPFTKRIVLQNNSPVKISYRLKCLNESDRLWLACSRTEGVIDPNLTRSGGSVPNNAQTVTLSFMVSMRGSFTSYLIVENLNNRTDTKIIRISMEVVAKGNYRRYAQISSVPTSMQDKSQTAEAPSGRVFDVYSNGIELEDCRIELSDVVLDNLYPSRSLIIFNRDGVPLDFSVKTSLTRDDETELVFSLSRTSAKLFRSITIEPQSYARVYLRFWAARDSSNLTGKDISSSGTGLTLTEANSVSEKRFDIYVNCRLVRDYQKVIPLIAYCRQPQILLSQTDIRLSGIFRRALVDEEVVHHVHFAPAIDTFSITNLLVDDILDYEVVSDSLYFRLEFVKNGSDIDHQVMPADSPPSPGKARSARTSITSHGRAIMPASLFENESLSLKLFSLAMEGSLLPLESQTIKVVPNVPALLQDTEFLRKERYIMDHFVIYNRRRPFEKYRVQVSLSFGHIDQFQFAVGSRRSIVVLESHIVRFLRMIESSVTILSGTSTQKLHDSNAFRLYQYIIDELIWYGTREQGSEVYVQLATLLFTVLLSNPFFRDFVPISPGTLPFIDKEVEGSTQQLWISRFLYFMGFFPLQIVAMDSLRELSKRFMFKPINTSPVHPPEGLDLSNA